MSLSVIDRYVSKKEKDMLDYAKILESIITIDNNNMWKKKSDFSSFAKEIIKIYTKSYYFLNNNHRDNPIEYSNDNINQVLKSIVDYFKMNNQVMMLKTWKNEIFLMSVIICTSCYVDFATNVIDGNITDTKNKFKYLLKYLSKTKILHISSNKYWINDLFDLVKKHNQEDKKALECINSDEYHNEYIKLNSTNYYLVNFSYKIVGLEGYDQNIRDSVLNEYSSKLVEISGELLAFQILKDLISNNEVGIYLLKVSKDLKKPSILKILNNVYVKKYIKILVPWEERTNYQSIIDVYTKNDIEIVYRYEDNNEVDSKIFLENMKLLVSKEFIANNQLNQFEFKQNNIELIVEELKGVNENGNL